MCYSLLEQKNKATFLCFFAEILSAKQTVTSNDAYFIEKLTDEKA
jgi:hypothetical protein